MLVQSLLFEPQNYWSAWQRAGWLGDGYGGGMVGWVAFGTGKAGGVQVGAHHRRT